MMLEEVGYDVLEAVSGEDALVLLKTHPDIQLLLSDITLPGMDGISLAEEAVIMIPGLEVILTSGELGTPVPSRFAFLAKPWGLSALVGVLTAGTEPARKAFRAV